MIKMVEVEMVYPNGTRALDNITFTVEPGEFVFIVGHSGSGKSTLSKILTGELKQTSGRAVVNNFSIGSIRKKDMPLLRRTLGVVFQDFRLIDKKTIYENVAFAMRVVGAPEKYTFKRVTYVLNLVGLMGKTEQKPDQISGGEKQRVAIARALVNNPSTIIADEPTGNLDPARSLEIMTLLEQINKLGTTVVVITHEKELVDKFSKRVIFLDRGKIVSDETGGYNYEKTN
ncbi:MAG: cell division ATP-binding protein FtsE [Clostridia bacterium]